MGVFEATKVHQDKCITALKRVLNYFPSIVNWSINTPKHVSTMKEVYKNENFCKEDNTYLPQQKNWLLECSIGSAEKCGILECINLSLFDLNNENLDQNLKRTGHQLIVLTAGAGIYRVNADMIGPTKSRV